MDIAAPVVVPFGPDAFMIDTAGRRADVVADRWRAALAGRDADVVPAAETVLVRCSDDDVLTAGDREILVHLAREVVPGEDVHTGRTVTIPVVYDGDDLADVARRCDMSVDAVVAAHTSTEFRAAFCGFAPGFAYLVGLPSALHLPRRDTPRTAVPAGSVAIAAEYSAVYPRSSPGGWHLIGHTDFAMFDVARDPPAIVVPGDTVRFVHAAR